MASRLGKSALGLICIGAGAVTGLVGAVMAWDARLRNALLARTVGNPWRGYLVTALGIGLIVIGILVLVRKRRSPAELVKR